MLILHANSSHKLTLDVQHGGGRAVACCAAVLALVSRSGVYNRQHGAPGTYFNIFYEEKARFQSHADMASIMYIQSYDRSWPGNGWLLALLHSSTGCAPLLTWHLKLKDSPWRTVADRGSTETTGAWAATDQTTHTHTHTVVNTCSLQLCEPWVQYRVNKHQLQSKQPPCKHTGLHRVLLITWQKNKVIFKELKEEKKNFLPERIFLKWT